MYKLSYIREDANKFHNTWVLVRGHGLIYTASFEYEGPGERYIVRGTALRPGGHGYGTEPVAWEVTDEDMVWAPPLPSGYYNLDMRPWKTYWLCQTGMRQYKVGLNSTSVKSVATVLAKGNKLRTAATFSHAALAIRDGFRSQPVKRALSMINGRRDGKGARLVGITPNLALEQLPHNSATVVVYRSSRIVGIMEGSTMHVDNTFKHHELDNLEHKNGTAKDLAELYRTTALA